MKHTKRTLTCTPAQPQGRASWFQRMTLVTMCSAAAAIFTACGGGGGGSNNASPSADPPVVVSPSSTDSFTVSGRATYASVPNTSSGALDYANTTSKPIRGATVQIINSSGSVLASGTTDASGNYTLTSSTTPSSAKIRVRAELIGANYSFSVKDNTASNSLYVTDSAAFTPSSNTTINIHAPSGWGGSSYTGARVAGPFSILDVAYMAKNKVASVAPSQALPALTLYWSINNRPSIGSKSSGQISTSHFEVNTDLKPVLYLLGAEGTDTDEYDTAVIAHEIGHFIQYAFSRNDSPGGPHTDDDKLDMRMAFSEGWGDAWSSMVRDDPVYTDSGGPQQASGFGYSLAAIPSNKGWYFTNTVEYLLWQFYKDSAIGFSPIYAALTKLASTPAFTSIYSFLNYLEGAAPASSATIVSRAAAVGVVGTGLYGTGETNSGGTSGVLPVYADLTGAALGTASSFCVTSPNGTGNTLGNIYFAKFSASGTRTITVARASSTSAATDPDFDVIDASGKATSFKSDAANSETGTLTLPPGTHVLAVNDYKLVTNSSSRCFTVTVK